MASFSRTRRVFSPVPWFLAVALAVGTVGCHGSDKCEDDPESCNPPPSDSEDSGTPDSGTADSGTPDSGTPDSGTVDSGTPDSGTADSGTPDSGTADSGTVDPNKSIVLTTIDTYYNRKGVELVPRDFNASPVTLVKDDGGTPISGTVLEPGKVRFDVPPGTYLMKLSNTGYAQVSWRSVDLSLRRFGRPNRGGQTFPSPAPASLNLTGLEPAADPFWPYFSLLNFNSLDIEDTGPLNLQEDLNAGQTFLMTTEVEYESLYGDIPRFDAAQGDTAWVTQSLAHDGGVTTDGGSPTQYDALVRAAHVDPFDFDGGTFSLQATLQPAPQQPLHFDWRRDEFNALRIASTGSPSSNATLYVYPALKSAQEGWIDYSVGELLSFFPRGNEAQTPLVKDFMFGNPYPAPWEPVAEFTNTYSFNALKHDGSRSIRTSESFITFEPVSNLTSTPVRPHVSLAQNFKVDGTSATTPRILPTTTPLVTWDAPAIGTATGYTLLISRINPTGNFLQTAARIYTGPDERSVRLPPGLLTAGNDYVLRLTARYVPGVRTERVWFTFVVPSSDATTSSGVLTVP
jgi:hypothetical protein